MRVFFSELCCLNLPLEQTLERLKACGAENIEFMLDGKYWDELDSNYQSIVSFLTSQNLHYSIHPSAWDMNLTSSNRLIRSATLTHHKSCIKFASDIGASQIVIHPGFSNPAFDKALAREYARSAIAELAELAKPTGVRLAVENVGTLKTSIYNQEEYLHCIDGFGDEVGFLLDVGHAFITGFDIPTLIHDMGDRLFGVHLHDNDGTLDQHLPIGEGKIVYEPIFKALKTARDDCHMVLEYKYGTPPERLRKDCAMLTEQLS